MIRCWLALALVVALASAARAQSPAAQAEILFRQGRDLMAAHKFGEACKAFEASEKLDPAVTTLLNLAQCREQNGQLATALATFATAEKQARDSDDAKIQALAKVAAQHAAKLAPRVSKLTIHVGHEPDGLAVTRDGEPVDPAMWNVALPTDGGTFRIRASAPGHRRWSATVSVAPHDDAQTVEVPELKPAVRDEPREPEPEQAKPEPEPGRTPAPSRALPIAMTVGSVVLLGGALGFELWGDSTYSDAQTAAATDYSMSLDLWHSANTKRYIAEGLLGAGVAAGGVAVYLWLHDRHPARERTSTIAPVVTRGLGGIAWLGSW